MVSKIFKEYKKENIHPGFSIDSVILSYHKRKLRVLLHHTKLEDYWALPGGFMLNHENADQAAQRIVQNVTGYTNLYLNQFHLFSDLKRIIKEQNESLIKIHLKSDEGAWLLNRFVTLGYFAFLKNDAMELQTTKNNRVKWYNINELPNLYADHAHIIKKALETIMCLMPNIPVAYELLPPKFTMSELRGVYEHFLGTSLDRRNFQRKILAKEWITQLDERKNEKSYNAPILYSFSFKEEERELYNFSI